MTEDRPTDLSVYASPPRRDLSYDDIDPDAGSLLDAGGQAWVYRVSLAGSDPPDRVALRELPHPETAGTEATREFLDQARTWEMIDRREREKPRWAEYEHIVGIVDVGEDLPWIAMEYMDGGSLTDRLETTPDGLPIAEALWIAECLCRSLEIAHGYGVVHLDLKPANVLFRKTADGEWNLPKLADWGLSRRLLEKTGSMTGLSAEYAAPEQFEPETFGDPDTLTDIYQLGALLYAVFTGRPPYTGSRLEIMRDVVGETTPVAPSERRPALPEALDDIILGALARDKSDRTRTVERVQAQLRDVADQVVDSCDTDQSGSLARSSTANTTPETASTAWPTLGCHPSRTGYAPEAVAPSEQVSMAWTHAMTGVVSSGPVAADGTVYVGCESGMIVAVDAQSGDRHWSVSVDGSVTSAATVARETVYVTTDESTLYAFDAATGSEQWQYSVSSYGIETGTPAVTDGTAFVGGGDGVVAVTAATGERDWTFPTSDSVSAPVAVADGTVYIGSKNKLLALHATTGEQRWAFDANRSIEAAPAVIMNTVIVGTKDGKIHALDTSSSEHRWTRDEHGGYQTFPAVSDDRVFVGGKEGLVALELASGDEAWRFDTDSHVCSRPAVTDDSVFVSTYGQTVHALDTATGEQRWQVTGGGGQSSPVVVDGRLVVGGRSSVVYAYD